MQRKELIVRPTAMSMALIEAATDVLDRGDTLPSFITDWVPSRALRREATWTVIRKAA